MLDSHAKALLRSVLIACLLRFTSRSPPPVNHPVHSLVATSYTTTPSQAKAFAKWFAHGSVGGFRAFNAESDNTFNNMVVTMLDRAFKKAHHMATNPGEYE